MLSQTLRLPGMRKLVTATQKVCEGQPIGQQIKDSLKRTIKNGASDLQAAVADKCQEMIEADNKRKRAAARLATKLMAWRIVLVDVRRLRPQLTSGAIFIEWR